MFFREKVEVLTVAYSDQGRGWLFLAKGQMVNAFGFVDHWHL